MKVFIVLVLPTFCSAIKIWRARALWCRKRIRPTQSAVSSVRHAVNFIKTDAAVSPLKSIAAESERAFASAHTRLYICTSQSRRRNKRTQHALGECVRTRHTHTLVYGPGQILLNHEREFQFPAASLDSIKINCVANQRAATAECHYLQTISRARRLAKSCAHNTPWQKHTRQRELLSPGCALRFNWIV